MNEFGNDELRFIAWWVVGIMAKVQATLIHVPESSLPLYRPMHLVSSKRVPDVKLGAEYSEEGSGQTQDDISLTKGSQT